MKYLENRETDPYFNLAYEEYVLKNRRDGDYLLLWQNSPAVVVGRHQNTVEEVDLVAAEQYGIQVVRRETGGGAVYHDLGNLNFSFITAAGDPGSMAMEPFTAPVIKALEKIGIHAGLSGRNDLTVKGRKVSGNAQTIDHGRILHHGTLLFEADLELAQLVLRVRGEKFLSKSAKSVRSRIGNLKDYLPDGTAMGINGLKELLLREFGAVRDTLKPDELKRIQALAREKYRTWEWNYGESPEFNITNRRRFAGGTLEAGIRVEEGLIAEIRFCGDFMSVRPVEAAEAALQGVRYEAGCAAEALRAVDVDGCFGGVTGAEVLECMFG